MKSHEQLANEALRWFEAYVKNAPSREKAAEPKAPAATSLDGPATFPSSILRGAASGL